ncbi:MAG: 3'-5' exonuclease [Clostridiales Family XIII bacterium]|jgi:DNA polymerase-3 subunit epsilon|nr:3'-5' exonuclease [Clostridiales Family XIII bacterium]
MNNYVVIDLETTGFSPAQNDIVELSAVRFAEFEPTDMFSTLVRPARGINYRASLVNGITEEMVEDAPLIGEVADRFLEFVKDDRAIVGQNIQFDLAFLRCNGIHLSGKRYEIHDTMRMAQRHLCRGEVKNHKLGTLCGYYGIKNHDAHRGVGDCIATGKLFAELTKDMGSA